MSTESWGSTQVSLSGHVLWGNSAVRFVFVDEAGTSENEPKTVVVGIIVHADEQLMFAERAIHEALEAVPNEFRSGYVFHATDVWGSPKYRDGSWPMTNRLSLLKTMMGLPRRLRTHISMGMVRRDADVGWHEGVMGGISKAQMQHYMAFSFCVGEADCYIRTKAKLNEVGTVVAEDVPEMRQVLARIPKIMRMAPIVSPVGALLPTKAEQEAGYIKQPGELRVSRIRNSIHFVPKDAEPLLYLADACAFGFRRYFSGQSFGDEFVEAILGKQLVKEDFAGPGSMNLHEFVDD